MLTFTAVTSLPTAMWMRRYIEIKREIKINVFITTYIISLFLDVEVPGAGVTAAELPNEGSNHGSRRKTTANRLEGRPVPLVDPCERGVNFG